MRLVLTSHQFFPDHAGGTEVLTLAVAHEMRRRGHEVEICTASPTAEELPADARFDRYEHEGVPVHRYRRDIRPAATASDCVDDTYRRWFASFLRKSAPDLVHFFHLGNLSASAIDAAVDAGIPTVMTPTDYWLICPTCQLRLPDGSNCPGPDRDGLNCIRHAIADTQPAAVTAALGLVPDRVLSLLVRSADAGAFGDRPSARKLGDLSRRPGFLRARMNRLDRVVAPTRLMQTQLVANGLDTGRVVLSRYGIRPVPPVPHVPDPSGRLRIGFIGTLSEHKGAHVLIAAVRGLPPDLPLELRIHGRPDFDPAYHRRLLAIAAGDPRVRWCGTFPNVEIARVFSELDVLVVPSTWYENTPLVIYSAQAAGCPVIATDLGGMSEAVEHGRNGLLFPAGDSALLARHLERVARDRELLGRLAAGAIPPKTDAEYVDGLLRIYGEVRDEARTERRDSRCDA